MLVIFLASLSSVGTAAMLAGFGFYLHRLGYICQEGKKTMARFSEQVALPALFFSKLVSCPSHAIIQQQQERQQHQQQHQQQGMTATEFGTDDHGSTLPTTPTGTTSSHAASFSSASSSIMMCPSMWESLSWQNAFVVVVLWPLFVVGCGLIVGNFVCWATRTPLRIWNTAVTAVAFANSTGLATTLLFVLEEQASSLWDGKNSGDDNNDNGSGTVTIAGTVDPNAILSLYLVLYQVLLWGLGGRLLKKDNYHYESLEGEDEGEGQVPQVPREDGVSRLPSDEHDDLSGTSLNMQVLHRHVSEHFQSDQTTVTDAESKESPSASFVCPSDSVASTTATTIFRTAATLSIQGDLEEDVLATERHHKGIVPSLLITLKRILEALLGCIAHSVLKKPPVCGALAGLFVSSIPSLRYIFVGPLPSFSSSLDAKSHPLQHQQQALLGWLLDAVVNVGGSAVPINMAILGANLSIAARSFSVSRDTAAATTTTTAHRHRHPAASYSTIMAVVIGKLVLVPMIGFCIVFFIRKIMLLGGNSPPPEMWLVMMMVFLTPTSNTVMLMVDLVDGQKEDMSRIMAWEYVFAPFILPCTVAIAVQQISQCC